MPSPRTGGSVVNPAGAVDGAAIATGPWAVFVIPPDRRLLISGRDIATAPFEERRGQRAPIDLFFRSLAAEHGDGCAVVLSGSGADGSVGVRAVKENGGIILVQDPAEAEYPMMPRAAIAAGADFVLPLAGIAAKLVELVKLKAQMASLFAAAEWIVGHVKTERDAYRRLAMRVENIDKQPLESIVVKLVMPVAADLPACSSRLSVDFPANAFSGLSRASISAGSKRSVPWSFRSSCPRHWAKMRWRTRSARPCSMRSGLR